MFVKKARDMWTQKSYVTKVTKLLAAVPQVDDAYLLAQSCRQPRAVGLSSGLP